MNWCQLTCLLTQQQLLPLWLLLQQLQWTSRSNVDDEVTLPTEAGVSISWTKSTTPACDSLLQFIQHNFHYYHQKRHLLTSTTTSTNGLFSRTTRVSRIQKGKTSLDLNEAKDDGVMGWDGLICKQSAPCSYQHLLTQFLQAGCSSWCPTNSVKALKAKAPKAVCTQNYLIIIWREQQNISCKVIDMTIEKTFL